jgi:hypothetical protein
MIVRRVLIALVLLAGCTHHIRVPAQPADERPTEVAPPTSTVREPPPPVRVVEFDHDVRPILEARCQPCHFQGGRMYERLPFDREETIHRLGTRLFTRIKSEDEQRVISALLAKGH